MRGSWRTELLVLLLLLLLLLQPQISAAFAGGRVAGENADAGQPLRRRGFLATYSTSTRRGCYRTAASSSSSSSSSFSSSSSSSTSSSMETFTKGKRSS